MYYCDTDVYFIAERRQASRFIYGDGIEIGPCNAPLQVNPKVARVRYVDRLTEGQIRERFPELEGVAITPVDILCDVAQEGLGPFQTESLDFIIANHLLEHCPNPLWILKEIYRVLRKSGVLYLALPDKDYTFDKDRAITPLAHLIRDLTHHTTKVEDAHLIDFIVNAGKIAIPEDPSKKERLFDSHRERSIHVHVWTWNEMLEFLKYMIQARGTPFELLELYLPKAVKIEAIFVLRKTDWPVKEAMLRFDSVLQVLLERELTLESVLRRAMGHSS